MLELDFLILSERDVRLANVIALAHKAAEALLLALEVQNLHRADLHLKQQFNSGLNFALLGVGGDDKRVLIVLFADHRALFRDDGADEHLHQTFLVHANISWI